MNHRIIVAIVLLTFFVISFITNTLGPIFPALIESFDIGLLVAGFFPFAFFVAYGVMSIPAGILVHQQGEKVTMLLAFSLAAVGALLFAVVPSFMTAMVSLFLIGCSMSLLQVAINPLLRRSGGGQHFAVYSVAAQLLFGLGGALSPWVYSTFEQQIANQSGIGRAFIQMVPDNMSWLSMYWLFAMISVVMLALIMLVRIERGQQQSTEAFSTHLVLMKSPVVIKFFLAIAAYVFVEQGVANSMIVFLEKYHGVEPVQQGSAIVSQFWLNLTLGCILGLILLKFVDAKLVLLGFSSGAIICLLLALFSSSQVALVAFPAVGFFLSVMWSVLFSLALNSVREHHGSFSGILCTGIVGGALASPAVGLFSELFSSMQLGMFILFIPLVYIFSVGLWAKPLIKNDLIRFNRKQSTQNV
ncbi:MFS transporter [Psychrobium sp. 1_MG-2023]|uniref:MFS transporter n=1 Tax=Psychrobium sp. 1_MG-2023 TaxID=3062624 RepID=UPI000C3435BB|nr:MFS transporter [Psychrobium sp. 1_MG-2023]MDP2560041.1 MFS transporter [Psychrobium sp. 1_MG-2023]PKF56297.1 MFS transporter [Alteromonadales bacterium alter-6D02]